MLKMSEKQKAVLDFIKDYTKETGYAPSCRDICDHCGLNSTSTAHGYLRRLEARGLIKRDPQKPRSITVSDGWNDALHEEYINIPVVGSVAAGQPILAVENITGYVSLPQSFVRDEDSYILIIKGDSMTGAGILNGDRVIARKQNWAQNGDIVIAMIDGEATCKRYFADERYVRLQPENPEYQPIYSREVAIIGKVTGLLRSY